MNTETLKQDLCARLPYGVKLVNKKVEETFHNPIELIGMKKTGDILLDGLSAPQASHKLSPILFPITCLTKEITVNGETFVPAIVLFGEDDDLDTALGWGYEQKANEFILNENRLDLCYPLSFWEKMNQLHINYRLSPDQFIEATNEYK